MTYSIVALDPGTGELGVAVATGWPAVGATVPWVEPGVGAVATQSFTNVDLGPLALERLRSGQPASVALRELLEAEPEREKRQVGLVDGAGAAAAHTGRACVAEAGHVTASALSIQANMVERADVWLAMQVAFERATGDLAERLLEALLAAEREGGDVRGIRSAVLLISPGAAVARPWARRFDLRVDLSVQPLEDLAHLLQTARAFEAFEGAIEENEGGDLGSLLEGTAEGHRLAPDDAHITFWHALALLANDRPEEADPLLEAALRAEPRLAEFARRYLAAGHGAALTPALRRVADRKAAGSPSGASSCGD